MRKLTSLSSVPIILGFLSLLFLSAQPRQPTNYVRIGIDALKRGEYKTALQQFEKAEIRCKDPGLVAYNKAVAYYHLRDYREAELHYRRSCEGADSERLARGLFGLGSTLIRQAGPADVPTLEAAAECFSRCSAMSVGDADLTKDAGHNLQLALLMLQKARQELAKQEKDNPQNNKQKIKDNKTPKKNENTKNGNNGKGDPDKGNPDEGTQPEKGFGEKTDKGKSLPGEGRIDVLPDSDSLLKMSVQQTRTLLQKNLKRIEQERRDRWQSEENVVPFVKDW